MSLKIYGCVVSNINCSYEAQLRNREEIKYSSLHAIVNAIEIDGNTYKVDNFAELGEVEEKRIEEKRVLLEISYLVKEGKAIERHSEVNKFKQYKNYSFHIDNLAYVKKGHVSAVKKIRDKNVLNFYPKVWMDSVNKVREEKEKTPLVERSLGALEIYMRLVGQWPNLQVQQQARLM